MNIKILPKWVGMLAMLFVPLLSYGQAAHPTGNPVGVVHVISKSEFDNMPMEKKRQIMSQPQSFKVEEISMKSEANTPKEVITPPATVSKNVISREEMKTMPADKVSAINAHPELYDFKD